ncbi:hypothetical protein BJ170DRAFT_399468 [Xylariales sp. AK1849]|nr:hypothetical protein BJ170DRAFT_399468 [Xylariales sp. AK1849]
MPNNLTFLKGRLGGSRDRRCQELTKSNEARKGKPSDMDRISCSFAAMWSLFATLSGPCFRVEHTDLPMAPYIYWSLQVGSSRTSRWQRLAPKSGSIIPRLCSVKVAMKAAVTPWVEQDSTQVGAVERGCDCPCCEHQRLGHTQSSSWSHAAPVIPVSTS